MIQGKGSQPAAPRTAGFERNTTETRIAIKLTIEGSGHYKITTGIRFFDHMLELFTRHGAFDLELKCDGDLDVDQHHIEDVGTADASRAADLRRLRLARARAPLRQWASMAAHSGGRIAAALAPGQARSPAPGADDFLSGESGTVGGKRDALREIGDLALDLRRRRRAPRWRVPRVARRRDVACWPFRSCASRTPPSTVPRCVSCAGRVTSLS